MIQKNKKRYCKVKRQFKLSCLPKYCLDNEIVKKLIVQGDDYD